MEDEFEDQFLNPGWIVMAFLCLVNELIDWMGILFNVTGVWIIVILILNLITLFLILLWRGITEGFSFSALFGTWKQALWLIVEHIPIVGDLVPGWLLFMLGFRKKKVPKKTPAPKVKRT